ncbi:MAG: LysM peptidoglycan-binding domain-containing protein [Gammaproteobacteria bacterium]
MRRMRQPVRTSNSVLHLAIRQMSAIPVLTGSMLLVLSPAAGALGLGDINVRSTLGQRLVATVPVRLGAGESLASACVVPGQEAGVLGHVPGVRVTTPQAAREGTYELQVTTEAALYEPMYQLELQVQCPGVPAMVRQYVLMLDLPAAVMNESATQPVRTTGVSPAPQTRTEVNAGTRTNLPTTSRRPASRRSVATIEAGAGYRVGEGDTLSTIAARVKDRTVQLQALEDAIQAANPQAFIRNDPNLIKLGSEILIPSATPGSTASSGPEASNPVAVPNTIPTPMAPPAPPVVTSAPVPAPQPVTGEPVPANAPVARLPTPKAAPVAPEVAAGANRDEPNPFIAAGAGITFGLLISTLLWFRGRWPARKRPAVAANPKPVPAPNSSAVGMAPAALVVRASEPGFSVSYTPASDDPLAAEFADHPAPVAASIAHPAKAPRSTGLPVPAASEDITSELEGIFDGTDTTIQKRLDADKTLAAAAFGGDADGYTPDFGDAGHDVDFLVGDPTGEEAALPTTVEQPRPNLEFTAQSPTVDLRTLATSATKDQQQAQTLLEALTLLERDYEEELTASQVLDMSAVRDALGDDLDEPTQISEARLREVTGRKKSR